MRKKIKMAIAYDFDGTLAYGNMQEHAFLPSIGMKPQEFWEESNSLAKKEHADEVLMYMYFMLKKANEKDVKVRKEDFAERGKDIALFEGVLDWFDIITKYAKEKHIDLEHILISSGNEEIFRGTPIAEKFSHIYASKFLFDHYGIAVWPALVINYTTKTQFLFRINKGAYDVSDNKMVNASIPKDKRPVPFENMIYIGDGETDIPCFRLVKEQGGLSIAVYRPHKGGAGKNAAQYKKDGRVHCVVPADYRDDKALAEIVKRRIDYIAAREHMTDLYI